MVVDEEGKTERIGDVLHCLHNTSKKVDCVAIASWSKGKEMLIQFKHCIFNKKVIYQALKVDLGIEPNSVLGSPTIKNGEEFNKYSKCLIWARGKVVTSAYKLMDTGSIEIRKAFGADLIYYY